MNDTKILVSDDVSDAGLAPLHAAGFQLDRRTGLAPDELRRIIPDYDALIVRSETKATAYLLEAARRLRIIGRAGVGVDNIDTGAATRRGIIVVNAPDGNTMTTAEHTFAMLLALARRVPQAFESLRAGKWERKKFIGTELRGKTLGIIGLGRIGRVVADRARAFEMHIVAYDPFVSSEAARESGIEVVTLEELYRTADFITVHTPLTSETRGLVGADAFALMKPGVSIINCARGGLVDEQALAEALAEGRVAGAALDVFTQEPPPADHPLLHNDKVIVTPHLGASTKEAQEGVAVTVAEEIRDYLLTGALRGAVNLPTVGGDVLHKLKPYFALAENLGSFQRQLIDAPLKGVHVEYTGDAAEVDHTPLTRAFLASLLRNVSARVNVVNSFLIAEERGIEVTTSARHTVAAASGDLQPTIKATAVTDDGEYSVAGSVFGTADNRVTEIDGFRVEAVPHGHLLVLRNRDVPGVVGRVGTIIGKHDINISRFNLGRRAPGTDALAVIELDALASDALMNELRGDEEILRATCVHFESVPSAVAGG
jgi:D-3-phosphoglycerate dehydrogenase